MWSKRLKRWSKRIFLFPLFVILAVPEGDGGGVEGGGDAGAGGEGVSNTLLGEGEAGAGGSAGAGEGEGAGSGQTDEEKAVAATKAEEDRRAALTQEERDAEDLAKSEEEKKQKAGELPETFADFTLPEGFTTDDESLKEFKDILLNPETKKMKISQEDAQKLVDLQTKTLGKIVAQNQELFDADVKKRQDAIKADKEIGGDKLKGTLETTERVLNSVLTAEEKTEMIDYLKRFGDCRPLYLLVSRVAGKMREDAFEVPGGKGGVGKKSLADKIYG